jgi:hypothetical protein
MHRRIIWTFSGNADITELTGADWTEDSGRNLPGSPKAESCPLPIQKPAREKGLAMGRVADCGENGGMPLGQTEAGLSGGIRRMDRRRALAALHLCRHARR